MKKNCFLVLQLLLCLNVRSQPNTFLKIYSNYYPPYHTGTSVAETNDGEFIITAVGSTGNTLLLKTDSAGNVLLSKSYCGANGRSLISTHDSNFVYICTTRPACPSVSMTVDSRVIKINSNLDTLWTKHFGSPVNDDGSIIIRKLNDNSFATGGGLSGGYDFCKLDSAANLIWNYSIAMSQVWSIIQDSENNFVLTGYLDGFSNSWVVIKTDSAGANVLWAKYYGTTGGFGSEKFYDLVQLADSNYLVVGLYPQFIMKLNKNTGDSIWRDTTPGVLKSIDKTLNGDYIAAGDYRLRFLNDTGAVVWVKSFPTLDFEWVRATSDGGFVATGSYFVGTQDWPMLLKTDSLGNFTTGIADLNIQVLNYSLYPNPVTTESRLEFGNAKRERYDFALYDIAGRQIENAFTNGDGITIKRENKQAGLYLFTLRNGNTGEVMNGKVVME